MNATMNGWHDVMRVTYAAVYSKRQDTTMVKVFFELDGTKNGTVIFQPEVEGPHFYWEKYLRQLHGNNSEIVRTLENKSVEELSDVWGDFPTPRRVNFSIAQVGGRQYLNVADIEAG